MEKQRLTNLINQPDQITERDFNELLQLQRDFPYFQAIKPLITISSKTFAPHSEKGHLQTSAIYAFDRKHLKDILTKDYSRTSTEETPSSLGDNRQESSSAVRGNGVYETSSSQLENLPVTPASSLPESFFDDLYKEMEALKVEKENYQRTLENFEAKKKEEEEAQSKPKKTTRTRKSTASKTTATKKTSSTKKAPAKKASTTAKKASTSKSKTTTTTRKRATATKSKKSTSKSSKTDSDDELSPQSYEHDIIEELSSREELKISDAHKKEQLEIINNFIENEPVLTKRLDPDSQTPKQEAEDLSASSTNLSDDVVSETLAKLMIKQGRKQKAVDIYKKLIWKFPQKKSYFVEIIEELKKES